MCSRIDPVARTAGRLIRVMARAARATGRAILMTDRTLRKVVTGEQGQSTVEASFALPIVLVLVLLLVQPGIILYDRIVMEAAAAEGCRLLATSSDAGTAEDFVRRRLSSVPEQDLFHIHGSGCSWQIELQGGEASPHATVTIRNEVRPVPLIGLGVQALGLTNGNGNMEIEVRASQPTQPDWAAAVGISPAEWVDTWNG